MTEETRIALQNYDWMIRNRGFDNVELHWDSDTLVYGDGGAVIAVLCEPGFPGNRIAQVRAVTSGRDTTRLKRGSAILG